LIEFADAAMNVGGQTILEYRIPAEDLDEFNANVVGTIDLIAEYR